MDVARVSQLLCPAAYDQSQQGTASPSGIATSVPCLFMVRRRNKAGTTDPVVLRGCEFGIATAVSPLLTTRLKNIAVDTQSLQGAMAVIWASQLLCPSPSSTLSQLQVLQGVPGRVITRG